MQTQTTADSNNAFKKMNSIQEGKNLKSELNNNNFKNFGKEKKESGERVLSKPRQKSLTKINISKREEILNLLHKK